MYIILMRHGEAEPETEDIANKNRSLTPKGMRQARKSARILSKFLKDNPIRIFTSPYHARARRRGSSQKSALPRRSIPPKSFSPRTGRWC